MLDPKEAIKVKPAWLQKKTGSYIWPLIYKEPFNHTPKLLSLDPKKYYDYTLTDETYIKKTGNRSGEIIVSTLLIIIGIWIIFYAGFRLGSYILSSWFIIPGVIFIAIALTKKNTGLVMDRLNGLISFPHAWWYKPVVTTIDDAVVGITTIGRTLSLKIARPGFLTAYYTLEQTHNVEYWCFMVWYMDRNRPLPPDKVFDQYRQKDFERRKAEGFPPPLYPSDIPTPEATPEQQKEREQYWEESFLFEDGKHFKYTSYPAHKYDKEKYG